MMAAFYCSGVLAGLAVGAGASIGFGPCPTWMAWLLVAAAALALFVMIAVEGRA